jgi:GNAT superfamily N-acetyltransferase
VQAYWNTAESSNKEIENSMKFCEISGKKISLEIQKAEPDKAKNLTQIAFAAKRHWGYPEHWIQLWSPILTITPDFVNRYETYVAILDNDLVGFCAISLADEKGSIEHLWVLPEHMGKGVGRVLFDHILTRCRELGARVLEIESDPNAQGFYERMGAKKVGEVVGEVDGQPRILPLLEIKL